MFRADFVKRKLESQEIFMKKNTSSIRLLSLALFLVVSGSAFAQTISVPATPFYRFITQNATLGHFLTSNYAEGTGSPYNYAYQPFPYQADIVPVVPGYTPQAGQGLLPLYRWQVIQTPRIYYYYSIYYNANLGSNYHYQGVAGYVLAANDYRGTPLLFWYSQSYGYYYTLSGEYPPGNTFTYHGIPFNLPVGGSFLFDKIPDPCEGLEAQRDECEINGGTWSTSTCSCRYITCRYCEQPLEY
jgi:hypothetical protein